MSDFTNYHLKIARSDWSYSGQMPSTYKIVPIQRDFETYLNLLERVGRKWRWTDRPKYRDYKTLKQRLQDSETQLYLFRVDGRSVGYCLITAVSPEVMARFHPRSVIEIENFGFFPEETRKGYGKAFLPAIFKHLFCKYQNVYLASRGTNHKRVIPFYESLGMEVFEKEMLPDDLLPESDIQHTGEKTAAA